MVRDLRAALLKKQEIESARLADFGFKLRVCTMRILAHEFAWIRKPRFVWPCSNRKQKRWRSWQRFRSRAMSSCDASIRATKLARANNWSGELGDPSPHRLA